MRLVLARAAASRGLLVAAGLAALATTVLITAFVQYAVLLPAAGARAALAEAPGAQRSIVVTSGAGRGADDFAARDAAVRDLLAPGLAGAPLRVHTGGYGVAQRLPDDLPGAATAAEGRYAVVAYLPDLERFANLVAGEWPRPVADGRPAQVALPDTVAYDLGLSIGDRVVLLDESLGEPRPVTVVGRFTPVDPHDPYWLLGAGRLGEGRAGPFVVHRDEFVARYQWRGAMEWLAVAEPADLVEAGMADVATAVGELRAALAQRRDERAAGWDASASLSTGLDDLAGRLATAGVVTRSGLLLPAALIAVIAVYSLALLARLLATHRRGEEALLRARGAGRGQVARFAAAEAALVVAPAAVLGGPLASWLVGQADRRAGSLGLAADLAGYGPAGPPSAWALAVGVAVGCAAALALPGLRRGRTWVAEQQERSRPRRTAALQRVGVDVVLVALAVLAWTQLGRYGSAVTPRAGGLGVDPLLVLAPVVVVLAATMLALRLLPVATRAGVWLASRRDTLPTLLGMWQADRRPHAGPVLLLVLALAVAVLAPTVAATWQRSQRDQAGHAVGADLRLTTAASAGGPVAAPAADVDLSAVSARLADLPEVAAMPVHRTEISLPDGARVPVLALDSARAAEVARLRPDLVTGDAARLFQSLRAGRPEPRFLPLPSGTRRLVGTVAFEVLRPALGETLTIEGEGGPSTYRPPASRLPTLYVIDADGAVHPLSLGRLAPGGAIEFDVALPAGAVAVAGLGAGLIATADSLPPAGELRVSWEWRDLRAVGGDGGRASLTLPEQWAVVTPPDRAPPGLRLSHEGAVVTAVVDRPVTGAFLLTDPAEVPPAPAVSSPRVLAATGGDAAPGGGAGEVAGGDPRTVALSPGRLDLVGTVAAVPGVADGDGLLVDLAWLSLQRFQELRQPPVVNEWWVATDTPGPVLAVAEELGLSVQRRDLATERLLADPLAGGVLLAQWAAAAGAALLAAFGLGLDSRVTAAARRRELAVLHTLGAAPRGLAGALVVEQAVLAGLGVLAGAAVGVGVAAVTGTSLVLTPDGAVPVPPPLLTIPPATVAVPAAGLLALAAALGALTAWRIRREAVAGALRIGEE